MLTVRAVVLFFFLVLLLVSLSLSASYQILASQDLGPRAYTASGSYESFTPDHAFDGQARAAYAYWNGGAPPPGWIEVDLQRPRRLLGVRLVVAQQPDGVTAHEVWCSGKPIHDDMSSATLVHMFAGYTRDRDVLEVAFPHSVVARYVQIRTTRSPSWVAWMKIQVFERYRM